ncbi:MAG TPA: multiheme c-type cytochrome [Candidatus Bathyarchaeia archaeon]|nr:multiheme c-type cytochrome [Candidatus Bathyarchaeia archaeon]
MTKQGKPYGELPHTSLAELGYSLQAIKEWREREHQAGRPSGLEDFYRAHGLCYSCRATGVAVSPVDRDGDVPLFVSCEVCHGTGKLKPL